MPAKPEKTADSHPALSTETLLAVFAATPVRLTGALAGLTDKDLAARPISNKWSIREITFHLADSEIMAAARFRQAMTDSDRTFSYYDQDVWASHFDYQNADRCALDDAVALFAALRATTTRLLQRLPADRWVRSGFHPERGDMSVRQLLESYAEHGEAHLMQLIERRRLIGKPLDLAPLLPDSI